MISYTKNATNEIFGYDDESNNQKIALERIKNQGHVELTQAEFILLNTPTLADLKTAKKAKITTNFEQTIQQITAGYPPNEIASWSKQEQEARAFTAVPLSPTPLIDALANTRGVPKATLAARVIAKADLFAGISGQLIGKRQGLEDAVDAATSKTALAAIIW